MRDFLNGLELGKETVDTIMAEYGKNVQGLKETNEDLKAKVKEANDKLERFKDVDLEKLNKSLTDLTDENKDLKAQIQMVDCGVKKEFSKFVRSEVLSKVDDKTDFETALKDYKKENSQYFGETVIKKVQTSPNLSNGGEPTQTTNDIMNSLLRGSVGNE